MPVLLAHSMEDGTDIFGISGRGLNSPNHPLRYATVPQHPVINFQPMGTIRAEISLLIPELGI